MEGRREKKRGGKEWRERKRKDEGRDHSQ